MLNRVPWPVVLILVIVAVGVAIYQVSGALTYGRPAHGVKASGPPAGGPADGFTPEQLRRRDEAAKQSTQKRAKPESKSPQAPSS